MILQETQPNNTVIVHIVSCHVGFHLVSKWLLFVCIVLFTFAKYRVAIVIFLKQATDNAITRDEDTDDSDHSSVAMVSLLGISIGR